MAGRTTERTEWFEYIGRVGITAAGYPFEYVKVLIQIGHEPYPPKPTRTLFGRHALALPGVFQYMKHIRTVDGFSGLFRGIGPKLCSNLVNGAVYTTLLEHLQFYDGAEEEDEANEVREEEISEEQRITRFVHKTIRDTIARCVAIIASNPFHVITIRTMAQFVGREKKYCGIFVSIQEVYRENGLKGYFAGLVPRLFGEILTLWLASTATFFINTYVIEEKSLKSYVRASLLYIASALTYPFTLVSNIMAVNNCGLVAGMPPNMPIYVSWTDCWAHLSAIGQLKRGSSILWRYYHGPYILDRQGNPAFMTRSNFNNIPGFKS